MDTSARKTGKAARTIYGALRDAIYLSGARDVPDLQERIRILDRRDGAGA